MERDPTGYKLVHKVELNTLKQVLERVFHSGKTQKNSAEFKHLRHPRAVSHDLHLRFIWPTTENCSFQFFSPEAASVYFSNIFRAFDNRKTDINITTYWHHSYTKGMAQNDNNKVPNPWCSFHSLLIQMSLEMQVVRDCKCTFSWTPMIRGCVTSLLARIFLITHGSMSCKSAVSQNPQRKC